MNEMDLEKGRGREGEKEEYRSEEEEKSIV
jgi:hypothetical protein